jgi:hypothetical protein
MIGHVLPPKKSSTSENAETPEQNAVVTLGPNVPPVGTRRLTERSSSCQLSASVQRGFVFGPVGPLLGERASCPQRPSNASQAYRLSGPPGRVGTTTAASFTCRDSGVVSSQPIPWSALAPSQSAFEK